MRIPTPNYTQTPNDLIDHWLPLLKEGELKVLLVIIRKTFGWQKQRDIISISQMMKITGMCRHSVINAVKSLQEKGLITKKTTGMKGEQETVYELVVIESNNSDQCKIQPPPKPDQSVICTPPPSAKIAPTKERSSFGARSENLPPPKALSKKENVPNAVALGLAQFLLSQILQMKPTFKHPNLKAWSKSIELMMRLDKRSNEEIQAIIEWLPNDSFWHDKVLSADTLRKQFDKLEIAKASKPKNPSIDRAMRDNQRATEYDNL